MSERMRYLGKPSNDALAQKLMKVVWVLTVVVLGLVVAMRQIKLPLPEGVDLSFLPAVNAGLNTGVALLLIVGLMAVLKGRITLHRIAMTLAVVLSVAFLLCYVGYHITTGETSYGGEGWMQNGLLHHPGNARDFSSGELPIHSNDFGFRVDQSVREASALVASHLSDLALCCSHGPHRLLDAQALLLIDEGR